MPRKKRAKGEIRVSLNELSHNIDLEHYLGQKPTDAQKREFAELAVDKISNRTLDGQTINGGKFKRYSKEYADSKGVTRDSVDLFLKGKMLDGIGRRTSKEKSSTVYIQMKKGKETKKAYNHNVGDTLPKREFFGLTDREAKNIANQVKRDNEGTRITLAELAEQLALLGIAQDE